MRISTDDYASWFSTHSRNPQTSQLLLSSTLYILQALSMPTPSPSASLSIESSTSLRTLFDINRTLLAASPGAVQLLGQLLNAVQTGFITESERPRIMESITSVVQAMPVSDDASGAGGGAGSGAEGTTATGGQVAAVQVSCVMPILSLVFWLTWN